MPLPIALLLAASTVATPVTRPSEPEPLPSAALFEETLPPPLEPASAIPRRVEPLAPPDPPAPPRSSLFTELPWIQAGSGSLAVEVTGLAGSLAVLSGGDVRAVNGPWSLGLRLASGGNETLGLTTGGVVGGYRLLSLESVDVTLGAQLLGGVASAGAGVRLQQTGVVGFAPEVAAELRIVPWLRASAALGWRITNVAAWSGPSGDALGGPGLRLGISFGSG